MRRKGPRVYEVGAADFPLRVEIQAVNLAANRAIVGDLRVESGGVVSSTKQPALEVDQPALLIEYPIARPRHAPPVNMTQTVDAFFDDKAPDNARYEITITAAGGDTQKTTIRVPTINPGTARLTFVVSE